MNRKVILILLVVEAAVCLALGVARAPLSGVFTSVMAFPFEQIGLGLRALSLSGGFGNAVAIVLYILFCLFPAAVLPFLARRRTLFPEDWLLVLMSIVQFTVIYLMINPGLTVNTMAGGMVDYAVGKAILGTIIYSIVCGYLVLRALRLFTGGNTGELARYMSVMLGLTAMLFVYLAYGALFASSLDSIAALRAGNTGNEHLLGASYAFLILRFAVDALPYILDIFVIFAALKMLEEFRKNRYSAESVKAAARVSKLCAAVLTATVLSSICFNSLQLLFIGYLMVINVTVQIPVLSIAFVLVALLLTRFVTENKQLKDDNDMFI